MPKFTKETARAAAAKRHRREAPPASSPDIAAAAAESEAGVDVPIPASMHGGLPPVEHAEVVVTPPPAEAPTIDPPNAGTQESSPAAGGDIAPTSTTTETGVEVTSTPFTAEIVEQFAGIAFDLAGAVTGRPHIWKLDPEEIKPIAAPMGRQLMRIPIIRAIGPDNTELMIVAAGISVIVTKRLNEHADEVQREREAKHAQLHRGDAEAAPARADIVPSREQPAAAAAKPFASEGGATHIGMRLS